MKLKTIKKRMRYLHRTAKKYSKSGGGKSSNTVTSSFVPIRVSPTRAESPRAPSPSGPSEVSNAEKQAILQAETAQYFGMLALGKLSGNPEANNIIENALAIDCEMVGVGPLKYDNRGGTYRDSSLARVTIVDFKGKKRYDQYVIPKEGIAAITDYRTAISGIEPKHLERLIPSAHSYTKITDKVKELLKNRVIVGHGLKSDFNALDFKPEVPYMVWDTAKIDMFMKDVPGYGRGARKLKELIKEYANNNIQVEGKSHSPLEDSKAAMSLYRIFFGYPKLKLN
jgi:hypothetical protein